MKLEAKKITQIYSGKVATKYDFMMPAFFLKWKRKAINESSLKMGDSVLVFCCGTGLDFPYILEKIGKEGKITGVDFSDEMLSKAKQKTESKKWNNIELIKADVTQFKSTSEEKFDVGICTLGLSIIPEFESAYNNLYSNIKEGGEIIIGDMQLATGWLSFFNPLTIRLSKKFGGTEEGHNNSLVLQAKMKKQLVNLIKKEFFLGAYYYCIGEKIS
jgi:ubiquinone/menaquinone biosynthesis C-methylase UbiE